LLVQVSCSKEFPDQIKETFVSNFLAKEVNEDGMIDRIEASLYISFYVPVGGRPFSAYLP
jgi:hypothetical protein